MKYFRFPKKFTTSSKRFFKAKAFSKSNCVRIESPDKYNDIFVSVVFPGHLIQGWYYGSSKYCTRSEKDYYDLVDMIDHIL